MRMQSSEVRKKFLEFFAAREHRVIASAPLIPENDPTTLFTGSGMQPLIPYLLGEPHPEGQRLVNSQKCFRAEDIDEVGDNRHTTFFEMLGNWSFDDYFKAEQLEWFFAFLVKEVGLNPERLYVTVFGGNDQYGIPKDDESIAVWKKLFTAHDLTARDVEIGTVERGGELGMQGGRIFLYGAKKNWWSRSGVPEQMPVGEPGGPDSEVFYEFTDIAHDSRFGQHCHPNCDCGRFLEIGNSVFMEFQRSETGFIRLKQRNVDFGGGLERITAASQNTADIFAIDLLQAVIQAMEKRCGVTYREASETQRRSFRIIVDHLRAAVFLIADGVRPSNKEQGYVVRRLLRRSIRHMDILGLEPNTLSTLTTAVATAYQDTYPALIRAQSRIAETIGAEEEKFRQTLARGLKEFAERLSSNQRISGQDAFVLFSTYGFPLEMTIELASERGCTVNQEEFRREFAKHQEVSRAGLEKKFHGGLADHSWETTRGHTATHLLHATLRKVLGDHVFQKGSNITAERIRFDFSHPQKLTPEQLQLVASNVNEVIAQDLPVSWREMTFAEAKSVGALGLFEERYGENVKVYSIGDYSREVCGGPHVEHTAQVGHFNIIKEEAVAAGVRRIKATVT